MIEEKFLFQTQTNIFKKRLYLLAEDALACNDWLRTINQEYVIDLIFKGGVGDKLLLRYIRYDYAAI